MILALLALGLLGCGSGKQGFADDEILPPDPEERVQGPAKDPRALYEAFCRKMSRAKAFRINFEADNRDRTGQVRVEGTILAAEDGRFRIVFDSDENGGNGRSWLASDGTAMVQRDERPGGRDKRLPVADGLFQGLASTLEAGGGIHAIRALASSDPVACQRRAPTSFLSASDDKTDGLATQRIEYEEAAQTGQVARCSLWLDARTGLPVKRLVVVSEKGKELSRTTETYAEWALDPPLPEGCFTLPPRRPRR